MAVVEVRNLTKQFDGGRGHGHVRAIDGINLATREGEYLVLLGPSGCGKTTLLRTIAGLEDPTDGEVLIGGDVVNGLPPRLRRIAMVFQRKQGPLGRGVVGHRSVAQPPPAATLRWGTATRRTGASNGQGPPGLPAGRAAVQSRRQAARQCS
jgi:ABC-type dipeptide/oligopeptide/nickel transport system ATPase subunit